MSVTALLKSRTARAFAFVSRRAKSRRDELRAPPSTGLRRRDRRESLPLVDASECPTPEATWPCRQTLPGVAPWQAFPQRGHGIDIGRGEEVGDRPGDRAGAPARRRRLPPRPEDAAPRPPSGNGNVPVRFPSDASARRRKMPPSAAPGKPSASTSTESVKPPLAHGRKRGERDAAWMAGSTLVPRHFRHAGMGSTGTATTARLAAKARRARRRASHDLFAAMHRWRRGRCRAGAPRRHRRSPW